MIKSEILNGYVHYWIEGFESDAVVVVCMADKSYYLTVNGSLSFERGSHTVIKEHIKDLGENTTMKQHYHK